MSPDRPLRRPRRTPAAARRGPRSTRIRSGRLRSGSIVRPISCARRSSRATTWFLTFAQPDHTGLFEKPRREVLNHGFGDHGARTGFHDAWSPRWETSQAPFPRRLNSAAAKDRHSLASAPTGEVRGLPSPRSLVLQAPVPVMIRDRTAARSRPTSAYRGLRRCRRQPLTLLSLPPIAPVLRATSRHESARACSPRTTVLR